jgi:hypothetical protein
LIDPPETDAEGDTRAFSIASAPYERDLIITTPKMLAMVLIWLYMMFPSFEKYFKAT